ncbi:DUF5675 family protein [Aureibacter tunicatorum]|uniref:DUF5675 domain-containing protein n=1 Tax=Aureibacter tunicatorum TaxID=866807 RepID=A0AAE3XTW3_9BACT|nr:DUF5675 family protein [Aureibacter tunicatorum]MDR6241874.1 hypothetical protein [Aureibacter tunicatorum]BDD07481.1 hypothetical protein AUTU_49640 [Aureibacter tunicatorum]
MIKAQLIRKSQSEHQTLGSLFFFKEDEYIFSCQTLELPWNNNQKNISCIPKGKYKVSKHHSPKFKECFKIENVENRTDILIHPANFVSQLKGCIAVGSSHSHLNNDKLWDTKNSNEALSQMRKYIPNEFELEILDLSDLINN